MIKQIIFDLDGVLIDSRELHFKSFDQALKLICPDYAITKEEHLSTYDGLPTTKKLELLTENKGLPKNLYNKDPPRGCPDLEEQQRKKPLLHI